MLKKERIPFPSSKSLETMKGEVSEEKEVTLGSGEKKFVRFVEKGGGLIGVPDKEEWAGILNHSLLTRRVATHLARELKSVGENVNLEVVSEAALLHDIGKRKEEEGSGLHPQEGAKILKDVSFSKKITEIVGIPHFPQKKEELDNWEKKIVFYSDLRAGQNIVSLDDRLEDIAKRWIPEKKINTKEMNRVKKIAKDVEQEIFSKLDITPKDTLDLPIPRVERYLRAIVERNLEDRAIKFFRGLEDRKKQRSKNKK